MAKQLLVYSSIAIAEPEEVEAWTFRNPECNERTVDDQLYSTYRTRVGGGVGGRLVSVDVAAASCLRHDPLRFDNVVQDTAFGFIVVNHVYPYILASFKVAARAEEGVLQQATYPYASGR